jgi:hypothetical protein
MIKHKYGIEYFISFLDTYIWFYVCVNGGLKIYRILNECKFNTEFIERVKYNFIIRASGEFNFSDGLTRVYNCCIQVWW